MKKINLAKYFDHTILNPDTRTKDIKKVCEEAKEYNFAGVCINPYYVEDTVKFLGSSTDIKVVSVIGFPLGATLTEVKLEETKFAINQGANEIDMVANISMIKDNKWDDLHDEIGKIRDLTSTHNALLKVIIETGYLSDEEKEKVGITCLKAGADYIKTCTGFGPGQATAHDVTLLYKIGLSKMMVKASGKIRSYNQAVELINAGANRLGSSKSVQIVT